MDEYTMIGEAIAETGEYMEVLSLILEESVKQTELLHGIYGLGWVLCGLITGCISAYFIYRMLIT